MATETNNGKNGGTLKGKPHSRGGIKAVVTDTNQMVELEGGEVIINKEASKKHWKELSRINQSAGGGVPILPPDSTDADSDPEEYKRGGRTIKFNPNHIPNKWIYQYAKKIKEKYPKVWAMGGNVFGNEAYKNLERVLKRGYWTDNEEWMYVKWQSFNARHSGDTRIAGIIANLKWLNKVDKGWDYMKDLIDEEIEKKYGDGKKEKKGWSFLKKGGVVTYKNKYNKKYGYESDESHTLNQVAKDTGVSKKGLQQIYNKGIGAYKTNPESVRPNVKSKEQWAMARVYSAVMGGKASRVDANELKMAEGGEVGSFRDKNGNTLNVGDTVKYEKWFYDFVYGLVGEIVEFKSDRISKKNQTIETKVKLKVISKWNASGTSIRNFAKTTWIPLKSVSKVVLTSKGYYEDVRPHNDLEMAHGGGLKGSNLELMEVEYRISQKNIANTGQKNKSKTFTVYTLRDDNKDLLSISSDWIALNTSNRKFSGKAPLYSPKLKGALQFFKKYGYDLPIDPDKDYGNDFENKKIADGLTYTKFVVRSAVSEFYETQKPYIDDEIMQTYKANKMAHGGGFLPPQGTLVSKDKKSKLDYKKVGDSYEFSVYDGETNPVENYSRTQFRKRNGNNVVMTYQQFINYIYSEGYIDDKAKGGELAKGIKSEREHSKTAQDLYNRRITPSQAPESIAREHLKEDKNYYSKLEKLKLAQGGITNQVFTLNDPNDPDPIPSGVQRLQRNSGEIISSFVVETTTDTRKPIAVKFNAYNDKRELEVITVYYDFKDVVRFIRNGIWQPIGEPHTKVPKQTQVTTAPTEQPSEPTHKLEQTQKSTEKEMPLPNLNTTKNLPPKPSNKGKEKPKEKKKYNTSEALRKYLTTSNVQYVSTNSPESIAKEIATQFAITMETQKNSFSESITKGIEQLLNS